MSRVTAASRWWALCRREWLEHRVSLVWMPLGLLAVMLVFSLTAFFSVDQHFQTTLEVQAEIQQPAEEVAEEGVEESADVAPKPSLRTLFMLVATPFAWLYALTSATVLLSCIYDERKDRSVLFWKSMPVSDGATVLSKLFTATFSSAGVTFICVMAAQLVFLLLTRGWIASLETAPEGQPFEPVGFSQFSTSAMLWATGLFTQAFWLLPIWGWLVFVSSSAPSAPVLWAVTVPATALYLCDVIFDWSGPANFVFDHLNLAALPLKTAQMDLAGGLSVQAHLWASVSMWTGILLGAAFVGAAIVMRGRNNEL